MLQIMPIFSSPPASPEAAPSDPGAGFPAAVDSGAAPCAGSAAGEDAPPFPPPEHPYSSRNSILITRNKLNAFFVFFISFPPEF